MKILAILPKNIGFLAPIPVTRFTDVAFSLQGQQPSPGPQLLYCGVSQHVVLRRLCSHQKITGRRQSRRPADITIMKLLAMCRIDNELAAWGAATPAVIQAIRRGPLQTAPEPRLPRRNNSAIGDAIHRYAVGGTIGVAANV